MNFVKMGVYDFDNIYAGCDYRADSDACNCNNGYICKHKDCGEECEDNPKFGKCYSFTCPLVSDCASKDSILMGLGDYDESDIENITFIDDDLSADFEKLVEWVGETK